LFQNKIIKKECAQITIIYINDWTIKNAYPLPLISEIIDKVGKAKVFKSLIYDGDTITYELTKVMSGRQHLLLGGDLLSHWICFLA